MLVLESQSCQIQNVKYDMEMAGDFKKFEVNCITLFSIVYFNPGLMICHSATATNDLGND
jgi:hypothetical protein